MVCSGSLVCSVEIYPVVELMDIYYGYRYGWLSRLLEVSDTVVLRPEAKLGKAFRRGVSIKQYLSEEYGVPVEELDGLKVMLDHGIFVGDRDFNTIFGVGKSPRSLVRVYDVLGVHYGLAYDVPSKLHVEIAVEIAVAKLLGRSSSGRVLRGLHPSVRSYVEELANVLLSYIEAGGFSSVSYSVNSLRQRVYRLIRQNVEGSVRGELRDTLYSLSERTVEETVKNLEEQVEFKARSSVNRFTLVPVVQGLFWEHAWRCLEDTINLLVSYQELSMEDGEEYIYVAIGTGGRVLSDREIELVNRLMEAGLGYARKAGVNVRFHILGWSNPKMARRLRLELVYSSDSLSARRRAVEGKVYTFTENGGIRLVHVAEIDRDLWSCSCPVCRDPKLRRFVLDPSGSRRNDARIVHNLWVVKRSINASLHMYSM